MATRRKQAQVAAQPHRKDDMTPHQVATHSDPKALKPFKRYLFSSRRGKLLTILFGGVLIATLQLVAKSFGIIKGNNSDLMISKQYHYSPLDYGVELSYILPMEVLKQVTGSTNSFSRFQELSIRYLEQMVTTLQEHSIQAGLLGHRVHAPRTWTINPERAGCELASYISPPRQEIKRLMEVFNASHYLMDAEITAMHFNVDARNRTKDEIRNVYKNFIAVEQAIRAISTSSSVFVSGVALSVGEKYNSVQHAYQAMEDPEQFPYPAWNMRTLPNDTIALQEKSTARPALCLTMKAATNTTKSFEFRGIQSSLDPDVVWAWVQFARKFVAISYAGNVLEPKERTLEEQWEALFGILIQDKELETTLRRWRYKMHLANPNRAEVVAAICSFMPDKICRAANKGLDKRKRWERQWERKRERQGADETAEDRKKRHQDRKARLAASRGHA